MKSSNQLDMLDTIEAITTSMFHHVRYSIVHRVLGSIILVQLYIIIKIARTCIVLSEHDANGKKLVYVGTSTYMLDIYAMHYDRSICISTPYTCMYNPRA